MSEAVFASGFERFLHKIYKEQGQEGVDAALALLSAIEEDGDDNED